MLQNEDVITFLIHDSEDACKYVTLSMIIDKKDNEIILESTVLCIRKLIPGTQKPNTILVENIGKYLDEIVNEGGKAFILPQNAKRMESILEEERGVTIKPQLNEGEIFSTVKPVSNQYENSKVESNPYLATKEIATISKTCDTSKPEV